MNAIDQKVCTISKLALKCFEENFEAFGGRALFPHNCCEEASCILLDIFRNENIYNFKLIQGSNDNNEHHFWLASESQIIDLTCHQFENFDSPLILIKPKNFPIHDLFKRQYTIEPPTNWIYLDELSSKIIPIFNKIYSNLEIKH